MKNNHLLKVGSFFMWLLLPVLTWAQGNKVDFTIKGKVTDGTESVIGASAVLQNTGLGSVTDIDGNYEIKGSLPAGSYKLIVSFVGKAANSSQIDIVAGTSTYTKDVTLGNDALNLSEVVVLGSSVAQERKQLGNAMTTVRADQLSRAGTGDAIQALQGKVAGAQISQNSGDPAGGISVRLRGAKSLLGSSEPLYVIDGVIANNSTINLTNANVDAGSTSAIGQNRMADINPNDIESLNVISGSAAAAIYGSRAANGVIVITTKRGKSGAPKIAFSSSFSMGSLRKKTHMSTYGKQFHPNSISDPAAVGYVDPQGAVATLYPLAKNGTNINNDIIDVWTGMIDVKRYDYQDDIFRPATGMDNNISISGGSDDTRYYASLSYMKNQGIIHNTDFQRISGRVRLDQKLSNWLNMSAGLMYANSFSNELPNGNVFWSPMNSINITNNIFKLDDKDASGNYKGVEKLSRINPLSIINEIKNNQTTNRTIADLQFTARPVEGLTLSYIFGIDNASQLGRNFSPIYPYTVNPAYYNRGYVANNTALTTLINNDFTVTFSKAFGQLTTSTVAGVNHQYSRDQVSITEGRDLAPFVTTVNGASVVLAPRFVDAPSVLMGAFLQETFGYADRLFLTVAARTDASSRFPKETRTNVYPKVGLSYVVSNESYFEGLKNTIDKFRIRASWGQSGNLTGLGAYDRFNLFNTISFNGLTGISARTALADPNIRVEKNEELEIGAELSFFKDMVTVGFSWYKQTATDLLLNVSTSPSQGGSSIKTNAGTLQNKGFELTAGITPIKTNQLSLNFFGTYSQNDNLVTSVPFGATSIPNPAGAPIYLIQGAPVGVIYGTFYARDPNGAILTRPIQVRGINGAVTTVVVTQLPQVERGAAQNFLTAPFVANSYRDANGQAVITGANAVAQRKIIGNPNPRNIWSAGMNFTYGHLAIRGLLDAVSGIEMFNADKRTRNNVGSGYIAEQELKGDVSRGTIAALANIEEWRVDDASFVKLRELSMTYSLGAVVKGISNLEIGISGRNLYSWDNYFGYDPETNAGGQSSVLRGIDFGNVPIPRTYLMTLKANF
jgi:TonB-linked SusC/RagA family outer membrane protein